MTRIVVTGASGSGGSYLSQFLLETDSSNRVYAPIRWRSNHHNSESKFSKRFISTECDLTDLSSVIRFLKVSKPEIVFNLAAHANVRASFDVPLEVFRNNSMATHNILEGLRMLRMKPLFIMGSTSEVYGNPGLSDLPITESQRLNPVSPYAASKAAQEMLALSYFNSFEIPIVITRMFTYLNPRRGDLFATAFARQVLLCKNQKQNFVRHGNLDSIRTILDIRDACNAYWVAAQKCKLGEIYNIAGSSTVKVGDLLKTLIDLSKVDVLTIQDANLLRPADVTHQIASSQKFREATGWKERYSMSESLEFFLDELEGMMSKELGH